MKNLPQLQPEGHSAALGSGQGRFRPVSKGTLNTWAVLGLPDSQPPLLWWERSLGYGGGARTGWPLKKPFVLKNS